jgi:hypothetical protein
VANTDDTDDTNETDAASSASDEDIEAENPGVNDDKRSEPTGVAHLEEFVEGLEAKLDDEIADLDSDYDPNDSQSSGDDALEENLDDINQDEVDGLREQTIADPKDDDNSNDAAETESHDSEPLNAPPLPRLRRDRERNYAHLKGRDGDGSLPTVARPHEFHHAHLVLEKIVMTQYNMRQGIKKFGEHGKQAVLAKLQQLYNRDVMDPVNKYDLLGEARKGALQYLMFLKEKRCGTIKGRGCADGRPQRDYMTKDETASRTVATEALILSCLIDTIEGRDMATCNIPGAFMHSDMEGKVIIKLEGVMAEVLEKIDPSKYEKHTTYENGKPVVYVKLNKALYGTLQAALLF